MTQERRLLTVFFLAFFLLTIGPASAQQPDKNKKEDSFALRNGDRVLFYGDSITAQRFYTRDVEEFVLTRYPSLRVDFFNAGVSGDTVYGGYTGDTQKRLARDVFPLNPTVVTVMLGMNDPGYVPFDQHIYDVFQTGYKTLLANLTAKLPGVRLTLIASSPYDEITHGTDFPGLAGTVQRYGLFVKQLAGEQHAAFADFNSALDQALRSGSKANPSYAKLLIPDRIHPSEMGHWVMAEALLRAWRSSDEVSRIEINAATQVVDVSRNADVSNVKSTQSGLTWTALEHALPLPFSPDDPMAVFTVHAANLDAMDQEILQVRGLTAKEYSLEIDKKPVATLTATQLNAGVNLALLSTPMLDQSRGLDWLEDRKMRMDAARFALEGEMPPASGTAEAVKTLRAGAEAVTEEQREKANPKPHQFALIAHPAAR